LKGAFFWPYDYWQTWHSAIVTAKYALGCLSNKLCYTI